MKDTWQVNYQVLLPYSGMSLSAIDIAQAFGIKHPRCHAEIPNELAVKKIEQLMELGLIRQDGSDFEIVSFEACAEAADMVLRAYRNGGLANLEVRTISKHLGCRPAYALQILRHMKHQRKASQ